MIVRHRQLQFAITNEIIGQSKEFHILFDVRHLIPDAPQAKTYLLSTTSPCCSLECNCADTKPPITTPLFSKAKSACSPNSYVLNNVMNPKSMCNCGDNGTTSSPGRSPRNRM